MEATADEGRGSNRAWSGTHRAQPKIVLERLRCACAEQGLADQAERVAQHLRDLDEPLLLMIVGEGKFGKSTIINSLVGRDIAPVGRLPKTWKVDLFRPCDAGQERALLHWRSKPEEPQVVGLQDATRICAEQEAIARNNRKRAGGWKSDLYQVTWLHEQTWPDQDVTVVDTPGFSQLRADARCQTLNLYGGRGIELENYEAFDHYYHRADVVLWCLKATKLEDQDTLEKLSQAGQYDKRVVGLLTHADRISEDDWPRVIQRAEELYGGAIPQFIPVAGGGKNVALTRRTIDELRAHLEREIIPHRVRLRRQSRSRTVDDEVGEFQQSMDGVMECYLRNAERRRKYLDVAGTTYDEPIAASQATLASTLDSHRKRARSKLNRLWEKADSKPDRFKVMIQTKTIDAGAIEAEVAKTMSQTDTVLGSRWKLLFDQVAWEGVRLGRRRVDRLEHRAAVGALGAAAAKGKEGWTPAFSGAEGIGVGLGVGVAAATAGALLLGPIGIAAGAVGYVAGKIARRNKCMKMAEETIDGYCTTQTRKLDELLQDRHERLVEQSTEGIEESFAHHHGRSFKQTYDHAIQTDSDLDALDGFPKGRRISMVPTTIEGIEVSRSAYFWGLLPYDQRFGEEWDRGARRSVSLVLSGAWRRYSAEFERGIEDCEATIEAGDLGQPALCDVERTASEMLRVPVESFTFLPESERSQIEATYLSDGSCAAELLEEAYAAEREKRLTHARDKTKVLHSRWDEAIETRIQTAIGAYRAALTRPLKAAEREVRGCVDSEDFSDPGVCNMLPRIAPLLKLKPAQHEGIEPGFLSWADESRFSSGASVADAFQEQYDALILESRDKAVETGRRLREVWNRGAWNWVTDDLRNQLAAHFDTSPPYALTRVMLEDDRFRRSALSMFMRLAYTTGGGRASVAGSWLVRKSPYLGEQFREESPSSRAILQSIDMSRARRLEKAWPGFSPEVMVRNKLQRDLEGFEDRLKAELPTVVFESGMSPLRKLRQGTLGALALAVGLTLWTMHSYVSNSVGSDPADFFILVCGTLFTWLLAFVVGNSFRDSRRYVRLKAVELTDSTIEGFEPAVECAVAQLMNWQDVIEGQARAGEQFK